VANGRIYFTSNDEFYCIGKKDHKVSADPIPPMPKEPQPAKNAKPAYLQVVPADVVLAPGGTAQFTARAFDEGGRYLGEVKAEWSLPRPAIPMGAKAAPPALDGNIGTDGKLTASKKPAQFGLVQAKAAGLTGRARIRVAPVLPYKQDFSQAPVGGTPPGWINAAGKFAVVELNGAKVLRKTNTNPNPLLARARTYIGMPTSTDYTIQADLMGTRKNDNLPDMGVSAKRYTLFLDGNKKWLRLTSWSALPRIDEHVEFDWKPDVWYRIKFTVAIQDGKGLLRGKVWPRNQEEPKTWTIQFTDPIPNKEGSPALYGYSTGILDDVPGSEVFCANISVTPNK
jgi:hypothetical protein